MVLYYNYNIGALIVRKGLGGGGYILYYNYNKEPPQWYWKLFNLGSRPPPTPPGGRRLPRPWAPSPTKREHLGFALSNIGALIIRIGFL